MKRFFLIAFLMIMAGCGSNSANNAGQPASGTSEDEALRELRIGIMSDVTSIPFLIAGELDLLPENVSVEVFRSAPDRDAALHAGEIEIVVSDMISLLLNNQGGFPLYAISDTFSAFGLVGKDVESVAELEGKQIGISFNTIVEYNVDRFLEIYGLTAADVEKVSVPQIPQRFEMLESGHIAAAAMPEPFPSAAENSGFVRLADSYSLEIRPGVLLVSVDVYDNHQDELLALSNAYDQAIEYINNENSSDIMSLAIARIGLPDAAIDFVIPTMRPWGPPVVEEFYNVQNWMIDKELLETEFDSADLIRTIR